MLLVARYLLAAVFISYLLIGLAIQSVITCPRADRGYQWQLPDG